MPRLGGLRFESRMAGIQSGVAEGGDMKHKARELTGGQRQWVACILLQCIGYGLYGACIYGGSIWSTCLSALIGNQNGVLDARMFLVAGTGVGCLVARALDRRGLQAGPLVSWACCGCMVACGVLACVVAPVVEAINLLAVVMGLAAAVPLVLWFDGFLTVYRSRGPAACLVVIAVATLLTRILGFVADLLAPNGILLVVFCFASLVISTLCQVLLFVVDVERCDQDTLPPSGTYRLTVYMVVLVASFGITAGLSTGVSHYGTQTLSSGVFSVGAVLTCLCVVAYALVAKRANALHFGQFIRLSLVAAGAGFAFAPLMSARALSALLLIVQAVGIIQGMAMTLLSVEISFERRLRMVDVMPLNYIVYVVCTCAAMELPAVWDGLGSNMAAWSVVSGIAVLAVVLVIPALPASSSTAATFSLSELPENETYERRAARMRKDAATKYGLSARETEVFELLVQGLTRGQIADRLNLSSWTVKEYVASVYSKVGVHSAKELMIMVAGGGVL